MTGQLLKDIIKKKGFKQNYIANEIGLHPVTLNKFLNGKAGIKDSKVHRLCEFFGADFIFENYTKKN